jgi:hypothetical protein
VPGAPTMRTSSALLKQGHILWQLDELYFCNDIRITGLFRLVNLQRHEELRDFSAAAIPKSINL